MPVRFPSAANGAGFRPLADWVHAQGLKFGIHIVRGIPRQVVAANLPIAGTSFHAADAADTTSPARGIEGNWGVKDNAAGQAYYDSMLKLYASWGVDFLKVDCIATHPYRPLKFARSPQPSTKPAAPSSSAFRPVPPRLTMPLKLQSTHRCGASPTTTGTVGPSRTSLATNFHSASKDDFDRLAQWYTYTGPGNWPDADMLPEGWLGPNPGWGSPRQSRLTPDEAANRIHTLVHRPLAAHLRWQPHQARCPHPLAPHQSNFAFHRPERQLQPPC